MSQKPSLGRIVLYNHPGDKTGKYPPKQSAAIITNVHDDETVDLRVFTSPTWKDGECIGAGGQYDNLKATRGDEAFQWNWPERV